MGDGQTLFEVRCQRVHVGVAVIIKRVVDGEWQVLMGLRKGLHGPGTWSFPGGWMEHGETPEATAHREVREETALDIQHVTPYVKPYNNTIFKTGVQSLTLFFTADLCYPDSQLPVVVEPDKCERWEWFPVDDLPSPLFDPIISAGLPSLLHG